MNTWTEQYFVDGAVYFCKWPESIFQKNEDAYLRYLLILKRIGTNTLKCTKYICLTKVFCLMKNDKMFILKVSTGYGEYYGPTNFFEFEVLCFLMFSTQHLIAFFHSQVAAISFHISAANAAKLSFQKIFSILSNSFCLAPYQL